MDLNIQKILYFEEESIVSTYFIREITDKNQCLKPIFLKFNQYLIDTGKSN